MTTVEKRGTIWVATVEDFDKPRTKDDPLVTHLNVTWERLAEALEGSDLINILPEQKVVKFSTVDGGIHLTLEAGK